MVINEDLLLRRLRTIANDICLSILRVLARATQPMRLVDITKATGTQRSTTCQALRRLRRVNIVDSKQHRYSLHHSDQLNALVKAIKVHDDDAG